MVQRWLKLQKRAQNEKHLKELVKILGEIHDLLIAMEKRTTPLDNRAAQRRPGLDLHPLEQRCLSIIQKSGASE
jgi:hypothetical protein